MDQQSNDAVLYVPEKTVLAIEKHVEASKKKRSAETEPKAE